MLNWAALVLRSAALAAEDPSFEEDLAPAALRLCVAMQLERVDDGVRPVERITRTVMVTCEEEIQMVARLSGEANPRKLRAAIMREVADVVHAFRAETPP